MKKILYKFLRIKLLLKEIIALWFVADSKTFWNFMSALLVTLPTNLRKLNVNAAFDKMVGQKCVFNYLGKQIILDGKYLGYAMGSYVRPDYFVEPHYVLKPGMTVLDLGATAGDFAILAALICERVFAIEARAAPFEELKRNAKLNNVSDKITAIHGIVGAESGDVVEGEPMKKYLKNHPAPKISMNDIFSKYKLNKVDFMKMDIEGSEFDLFSRNTEWLSKVDKIAAEVHSYFGDLNWLKDVLEKKGFEVTLVIDKDKSTVYGIGKELLYARKV